MIRPPGQSIPVGCWNLRRRCRTWHRRYAMSLGTRERLAWTDAVSMRSLAAAPRLLPYLRRGTATGGNLPTRRHPAGFGYPNLRGGQRGLGIPNVVDRWVQQAVLAKCCKLHLSSRAFHASSHGFRPGRGAQTAIDEAKKYLAEGFSIPGRY